MRSHITSAKDSSSPSGMLRHLLKMASIGGKRKRGENEAVGGKKPAGHWSQGLKTSMEDPELKVDEDETVVIIKDKYPKARHHFLIMPKKNISSLKVLTKDDIPLLKHMEKTGKQLAEKTDENAEFRFGYHAVPSMSHIHLHVISQDFDSPCLKNKKHWNSFTTEYFIDSEDVINMIEENGKYHVDTSKYEEMLKRPLRCHKCKNDFTTIPALKKHLLSHVKTK